MKKILIFFLFFITRSICFSSVDSLRVPIKDSLNIVGADTTTKAKKTHSPKKAALFSAVLPGLGQAYNKKYWKVPIIYAGFAGLGYGIVFNGNEYRNYRKAYQAISDTDATTNFIYRGYTDKSQVYALKEQYKKNMDLCAIFTGVWYALNIIDAVVDAHLTTFDVSNDLTMNIKPSLSVDRLNNYNTVGQIAFSFNFKQKNNHAYRFDRLR